MMLLLNCAENVEKNIGVALVERFPCLVTTNSQESRPPRPGDETHGKFLLQGVYSTMQAQV